MSRILREVEETGESVIIQRYNKPILLCTPLENQNKESKVQALPLGDLDISPNEIAENPEMVSDFLDTCRSMYRKQKQQAALMINQIDNFVNDDEISSDKKDSFRKLKKWITETQKSSLLGEQLVDAAIVHLDSLLVSLKLADILTGKIVNQKT